MKVPAALLLKDEWAALFVRDLIRKYGKHGRYVEISAKQLTSEADRFANKYKRLSGDSAVVDGAVIVDAALNHGWIEPSAADTMLIRKEMLEIAR